MKECRQDVGEDIRQFVTKLKKASVNCKFGANLDDYLCDHFVLGLQSVSLRKRILSEGSCTFAKAKEIATSFEATTKDILQMMSGMTQSPENFNLIKRSDDRHSQNKDNNNKNQCFCCGKPKHVARNCRYKS